MREGVATRAIAGGLLVLAVLVVFWPVLGHDFTNFDDDVYVTANGHVTPGLSLEGVAWAWTTGHAANWHPLTWMSHMLDCSLFGLQPRGHHLTSLLLHALNALLVFGLFERLTRAPGPSAVVAALFALHPLHVESVAWVAERKDVLSTSFLLLTLLAYRRYAAAPRRSGYALVALLLALGLAAKPSVVTVPFLLLLLDFWPLGRFRREGWRRLVVEKVPLAALALASSWVTWTVQRAGGATGGLEQYPWDVRVANAALAYVGYLVKTVWPVDLAVFYPHPGAAAVGLPALLAAGVIVLITAAAWRLRASRPWLLVGWLWYLVTLLPMIGLVQVGEQALADRYTYVPLIGIFLAVVWAVADPAAAPASAAGVRRAGWRGALALAVLALLSVRTRTQVGVWRDSVTLFGHAIAVTGDNPTAELNLAMALADDGDLASAARHYREALRVRPDFAKAHNNLGVVLATMGEGDLAERHYRDALRGDPGYTDAWVNLGAALAARGQRGEALEALRRAVQLEPDSARARFGYGTLLAEAARWDEAVEHLERAIAIAPEHAEAHFNLALTLHFRGDAAGARREIAHARRLGYRPPAGVRERLPAALLDPGGE